ncbi:MAG: stage II sporulation protein D [Clostridia bacterium]|nr:stage II sporulation protein D [Clostridia bacterium]
MKMYGILCVITAVIMIVAPLSAISFADSKAKNEEATETETLSQAVESVSEESDKDTISVFMTMSNSAQEMDMREYIIGTVAAEMPASYDDEALKAQALAAVTYAEYQKKNGSKEDIDGADISDNSSVHQGYMTKDEMREKWGEAFDTYYQKISNAVDAVIDKVITYNGEPIMAAYHAISFSTTESAKAVWTVDIPYLSSVESKGDADSARYLSTVTVTDSDLKELMGKDKVSGDGTDIKINSTSDAGTVTDMTVCGESINGTKARELFSLRSPCFSVEYEDGEYTFTVKGYGHGVGLSQYGADWYAKQGMTYDEIIKHYYTGVEIEER